MTSLNFPHLDVERTQRLEWDMHCKYTEKTQIHPKTEGQLDTTHFLKLLSATCMHAFIIHSFTYVFINWGGVCHSTYLEDRGQFSPTE